MPLNEQPRTATSPLAYKNIPKPSRLRVANGDASGEPPQGEWARYGPPLAKVDPPRGANLSRSESQSADLPSSAQTPARQHLHPPPPPKDLSTPGRPFAPQAPGVAKISSSRWAQDTAQGEPQAFRERPLPGVPTPPNESRETAPPLNLQPAPNDVSHLPVRHSAAIGPPFPSDTSYHLNHPPRPGALTIPHRPQITP